MTLLERTLWQLNPASEPGFVFLGLTQIRRGADPAADSRTDGLTVTAIAANDEDYGPTLAAA